MDLVGRIYRPPSEARSLLLQVTVGCSHNRCTYCDMYRDKQFRAKPFAIVEADLREAAAMGPGAFRRIFLCDGDALILSTARLMQILRAVSEHLPWVERVATYGDTRSVLRKPVDQLRELSQAGLTMVYHGMESGNDEVLRRIDKGGTAAQCVETAHRLREAAITHSVMVLLGVGGAALSRAHARDTARTLTAMDPPFVGALTTTIVPGTPLAQLQHQGSFRLPDKFTMLRELRTIVDESDFTDTRFSANHASNYLPLRARLPQDKRAVVTALDRVLDTRDERYLKPEHLRGL